VSEGLFVVVAGGDPIDEQAVATVPPGATVIAADSGADHARRAGLRVDILIGDLDSATPATVAALEASGTEVQPHPAEKDETDLELAIGLAAARGAQHVHVLGGTGGRLDHFVANVLLLASDRWRAIRVTARMGPARVYVVRDEVVVDGTPGELITLLAVHGPAKRVTTTGLAYALHGEDLEPGSSRGVSNVFAAPTAQVRLDGGVLLVIVPGDKFP